MRKIFNYLNESSVANHIWNIVWTGGIFALISSIGAYFFGHTILLIVLSGLVTIGVRKLLSLAFKDDQLLTFDIYRESVTTAVGILILILFL